MLAEQVSENGEAVVKEKKEDTRRMRNAWSISNSCDILTVRKRHLHGSIWSDLLRPVKSAGDNVKVSHLVGDFNGNAV